MDSPDTERLGPPEEISPIELPNPDNLLLHNMEAPVKPVSHLSSYNEQAHDSLHE